MSTYNCRGVINGIIVQNNPVNFIDPDGLEMIIVGRGFYDTYLEPAIKPTSDIFDIYQGVKKWNEGFCPGEGEQLSDFDYLFDDPYSQMPEKTESESTNGAYANDMGAWAGHE